MRRVFGLGGASRQWKVAVLSAAIVGTLAIAGIAYSTGGPNAQLVSQDRIYGGGQTDPGCFVPSINFCRPLPVNFAIDAHATGTGQAAYGDYTNGAPGFRDFHGQITCLAADGQNAVIGGITVSSSDPSIVGNLFAEFFVDRGTPSFGDRDLQSPLYSGSADPSGWPPDFPYVCPSPDTDAPNFGLIRSFLPIAHGDIVVRDGRQ
jgi:hypothetical protein